jgi:hypothetical protein
MIVFPMEDTEEKKTLNYYLIFAGVLVLIVLGYLYFQIFGQSPIPQEFFAKYNQQDTTAKKVLQSTLYDYGAISKAISAKDNAGAANFAKADLIQSLKNQDDIEDVQKTTTEMKLLLSQITDSTLREKVTHLFDQLDERNNRTHTLITSQTNTFTVLRDHFASQSVGVKGPEIPQNIDAVIQSSISEIQSINALQTTIDSAYQEIVKLAGVDTTVSQTADSIRMSLSATPVKDPTITDYPTPTPQPTEAPTATPQASASATPSPVASSSAQ